MCLASLLLVAALVGSPAMSSVVDSYPPDVTDTLEQRLAPCAFCHGKQGEGMRQSEYYPRIAGKPAGYLYRQLLNFRNARRKYPQMVYFVRHLPDAYLREIANHYASLHPPFPAPARATVAKEVFARGAALVLRGDPAKDIPPCADCHGKALNGMLPAIPGLVGLYPDYINAQLGAWQRGSRRAAEPDCMAEIAKRLDGQDVSAVAAWLAAQPALQPSTPASTAQKLPMQCGSQAVVEGERP
jgi:cytochrome c553